MLLRSQAAASAFRIHAVTPVVPNTARSFHTRPDQTFRQWPLKSLGGGLVAAGSGWYYLGNPTDDAARSFSVHSPLESDRGDGNSVDGSSTLLRPASPAAPRRQTVTLVFLTSQSSSNGLVKSLVSNFGGGGGEREKWFPWIGYFREAGYDCLQMNLALPGNDGSDTGSHSKSDSTTARLADELHEQIRLSNLQRQPVLFVHHTSDSNPESTSQIVSSYIEPTSTRTGGGGGRGTSFWSKLFGGGGMFGGRPAISGLVVISDLDDASALTLFGKHPKLNTLIVANGGASTSNHEGKVTVMDAQGKKHDGVVKDIERWLISQGYEG
ncbi:nucleosome assembly protein [Pseudozyma hubeiensis SY62]|uniref:Nucleosome assembly protein n=1 Tax=Pseudozyma hubeiensis (strain SY62) TaxID=1305764 RepID=R9P0P4_PSEHS|nr:nucleosome assembly protein [Pseudozyma hubeiensis SY62]GAC94689.1 nucleosome assembly protein [Pseudozyma hubeiensis SY62]